jgi:conjugative relaxase-like TrwC/TraI family protein
MLSVAPLAGGPGYYLALANVNYYLEGGEPVPLWAGTAAQELGLEGVARREHVERLCSGFHHETGEALVRNAGKDERNPGHDCTFSAPKSVSIAWALGDDELRKAIEQKQLAAVKQALDYLEEKAGFARVGAQGQGLVKAPLLACLFEHGTSRAKDPQLHTHALIINLTVHPDGRTTALDSTYLYHFKMAAGAVYRAALAQGMQQLGFTVEQRTLGSSIGFEIAGIPKALIEEFSKRRAEIEETLKLRAGSLDAASSRYAELVTKETRRTKDTEVPRAELLRDWQAFGQEYGIDAAYLRKQLAPFLRLSPEERDRRKELVFSEAVAALSEQHAHWNEADLTKAVAERAAGRISARDARELVENKLRSPELIHLGGLQTEQKNRHERRYIDRIESRFTTPEIKRLEQRMLLAVERICRGPRNESRKELVEAAIAGRPMLNTEDGKEQAEAVRYLTSGPRVRLMSGVAGTGKTTTLVACHDAWKAEGRRVLGCALAGAAAKRLEEGTGIRSDTLQATLYGLDNGRLELDANSVLLVDEAGQLGTKQLASLVEHVQKSGARLVLVGDAKQLQPIAAGGPFKFLADEHILGEVRLTKIRRQEEKWAREAVAAIEKGEAREAIKAYVERGRFHLADDRPAAIGQLIEQWQKDGGVRNPEGVFLLASTNAETKELNLRAQAERVRAGEIDPEKKLYANGVFFHEGDRLQFQKRSRVMDIENSDSGTVTKVELDRNRLAVRLDKDGRELTVDLRRYAPENLRLGYASTTHKAQGASLPVVHVLMGGPLTDLHMGYVQISRSKKSTHLFCDKHTAGGPELSDLLRGLARERQKTMAAQVELDGQGRQRVRERGLSLGL